MTYFLIDQYYVRLAVQNKDDWLISNLSFADEPDADKIEVDKAPSGWVKEPGQADSKVAASAPAKEQSKSEAKKGKGAKTSKGGNGPKAGKGSKGDKSGKTKGGKRKKK